MFVRRPEQVDYARGISILAGEPLVPAEAGVATGDVFLCVALLSKLLRAHTARQARSSAGYIQGRPIAVALPMVNWRVDARYNRVVDRS